MGNGYDLLKKIQKIRVREQDRGGKNICKQEFSAGTHIKLQHENLNPIKWILTFRYSNV